MRRCDGGHAELIRAQLPLVAGRQSTCPGPCPCPAPPSSAGIAIREGRKGGEGAKGRGREEGARRWEARVRGLRRVDDRGFEAR